MTFKEFCITGLKIVGSIAVGIAAFLGINKIIENCNDSKKDTSQPLNNKDETNEDYINNSSEVNNNTSLENNNNINKENKLVTKVRDAQNIIGKLFSTVQSLSVVIESFIRLFDKNSYTVFNNSFQSSNYFGGYRTFGNGQVYPQRIDMGNGVYANRLSPFIIEVPPMNPNGYYHKDQYPF